MPKLFYTPPTRKQFDELKNRAIDIWNTYDNEFGYADEKINKIKDIENIQDNFMYMVAMFDIDNQAKLAMSLTEETRLSVRQRMVDGGVDERYIVF